MRYLLALVFAVPLLAQTAPKKQDKAALPKPTYGVPQAQSKTPMVAGPAQQVSMAQIRLRDAVLAADGDALKSLLADDCLITLPSGMVLTKKEFLTSIARSPMRDPSLPLTDMQVRVLASTAAAVTARVQSVAGSSDGTPCAYRLIIVWQKQAGEWKAVVVQATRVRAEEKAADLHLMSSR
jgi:ketosteroid isomerase-like protein